jgi:hypothetical protein
MLPTRLTPRRPSTTTATTTGPSAATPAVTAATAKPVAAAATTAAKTTSAWFARARFIHRQSSPTQFGAIQCRHRLIRIRIYGHLDKRKTASLTCIPILHNLHSIHLAVCGKCRIQILLRRLERNVPDINILQGVLLLKFCRSGRLISRELISAGKLIKAGKVAVGGFKQPYIYPTALLSRLDSLIVRLRTFAPVPR